MGEHGETYYNKVKNTANFNYSDDKFDLVLYKQLSNICSILVANSVFRLFVDKLLLESGSYDNHAWRMPADWRGNRRLVEAGHVFAFHCHESRE